MKTTFQKIRDNNPCQEGWKKLLEYHNPESLDQEISIREILESNGIEDSVWALRAVEDKKKVMLFSADVAESVLHIFERSYPEDQRVRNCIEVVRKYANGEVGKAKLEVAKATAKAAAKAAAYTATYYAYYAAYAAYQAAVFVTSNVAYYAALSSKKWEEIEEILLKYL